MLKLKPAKYITTVIGQFGTPSTVTISCQSVVEEQLNGSNLIIIGKEQHIAAAAVLMYIDI